MTRIHEVKILAVRVLSSARAAFLRVAPMLVIACLASLPWAAHSKAPVEVNTDGHEPIAKLKSSAPVVGIVSAGSTFRDTSRDTVVNTIGSASLVKIEKTGQIVALTAAHVIGGEKPWISIGGEKVDASNALIDNDHDVAVIELRKSSAEPAFSYDGKQIKVLPRLMNEIDRGRAPIVVLAYYFPSHALGFALSPWVDPGTETQFSRGIVHAPVVSLNHGGEQIRIYTKVTSGASGSSVFDLKEQRVVGVVVQSHYYFSETYLASEKILLEKFAAFTSGQRGLATKTVWRMHNGLTYRIFEGGVEEANFTNRPTQGVIGQPGAGTIGQPGKGTIGQPGKGTIGQPGKGTIGQPGKGTIGQPGKGTIGQPGSGVIGQPSEGEEELNDQDSIKPWTESPSAVFEFYKVKPGMVVDGETFIGLRARSVKSQSLWPNDFILYAEGEALKFVREKRDEFRFSPVSATTDFVAVLKGRLGLKQDDSAPVVLKTMYGPSAVADNFELQTEADKCKVTVTDDAIHVRVKTYSRLDRETWQLVPDEVEFTLQKNGAQAGQREFIPVIETKGLQTGETYYVDLRQFFFVDLSQLIRPMPDWSKENAPFDLSRFDLKKQLETAGFSVRNAKSGAEFTYGFTAPSRD